MCRSISFLNSILVLHPYLGVHTVCSSSNVADCPLCRYVLRNWIAQEAIDAAEKGDFSEVQRVLELLECHYSNTVTASGQSSAK